MLTQTYPLIKDPKMLLSILENVFLALTNAFSSVIYYERMYKRVPLFQDNFESKFDIFKTRVVKKYNIDKRYVELIRDVKEIIIQHRKSPIEFQRKDSLVICNESYHMKTVSVNTIKEFIEKSKDFILIVDNILKKERKIMSV